MEEPTDWNSEGTWRRVLLALALLATFALASFVVHQQEGQATSARLEAIDLAGRERLATQEIALRASELVHAPEGSTLHVLREHLLASAARLETSYGEVLANASVGGLFGGAPEGLQAVRGEAGHDLDRRVAAYVAHARALATAPADEVGRDNLDYRAVVETAAVVTHGFDALVGVLVEQGAEAQARAAWTAFVLFGATLFVLATVPFWLVQPAAAGVAKATARLERRNRELADEMAARTEAAEERARELERSNADLEQFAYVASHDLQEPIRMVSSYVQLLDRRYAEELDDNARDYIRFAVEGSTRMQALIHDLLSYARVGAEPAPLVAVDLSGVLDEALADLAATLSDTGAQVTVGELPAVLGDRTQLRQVFTNLLSNAIKFRGEAPPRVEVRAAREGSLWRIEVQDNGIGVDPRFANKLFHLFKRLHTRSEYEGNGVGLALCRKVVEHHGGRIGVDGSPGEGSTFSFTLHPVPEPTPAAPKTNRPPAAVTFEGRTRDLV